MNQIPPQSFAGVWPADDRPVPPRQTVAAAGPLDVTGTESRTGEPIQPRSVLVKLIAEYARHNGHADLLRESIDGATGM